MDVRVVYNFGLVAVPSMLRHELQEMDPSLAEPQKQPFYKGVQARRKKGKTVNFKRKARR